ncbi:MAG: hypothetical protein JST44_21660 [Cyanobacteria bacterium SZAS LIN-5]|nr:hypothetical protein [Cyanobacteria bacterium SZAS LIN-5]
MYSYECIGSTTHRISFERLSIDLPPKPILSPLDRNRWGQRALAKTALVKRDFTLAKRHIDKIATKAKDRKDMPAYASALNEVAFINILMGKPDVAAMVYKQIYEIWMSLRMAHNSFGFNDYMFFLWDYSVFLRNQNEDAVAERLEKKLERLTTGMPMTFINFSRAERLADRGQFVMAEQFYEDAFVEAGIRKDVSMQLRIADRLAPVYQITGKAQVAEHLFEKRARLDKARCISMFGRTKADENPKR